MGGAPLGQHWPRCRPRKLAEDYCDQARRAKLLLLPILNSGDPPPCWFIAWVKTNLHLTGFPSDPNTYIYIYIYV